MHNIHCRYVSYVNSCYFMGFWHAYVQLRISIHIVIFLLLSQFPHFLQFGHMLQALQADWVLRAIDQHRQPVGFALTHHCNCPTHLSMHSMLRKVKN